MSEINLSKVSSHWYREDGTPQHDADLRVARKEKLLPSVTTVIYMFDNFALNQWKIKNAIMSALTLPKQEGEDLDNYAQRVVADMEEQSKQAKTRGTLVHDLVQAILEGKTDMSAFIDIPQERVTEIRNYLSKYDYAECEKVIINKELGFAGRTDCIAIDKETGKKVLLDWKTQGTKKGRCTFYPEWGYQLAAYSMSFAVDQVRSVIISTTENIIKEKTYADDELRRSREIFTMLLNLFKKIKNLD